MWVLLINSCQYYLPPSKDKAYTVGRNNCDYLLREPYISKHHLNIKVKPSIPYPGKVQSEIEFEVYGKASTFIDDECYKASTNPVLNIVKRSDYSNNDSDGRKITIKIGKFDRKNNKEDEFIEFELKYVRFDLFANDNINDFQGLGIDHTVSREMDTISHYITKRSDPESLELIYSVLNPVIDIVSAEKWNKAIGNRVSSTILKSNQFLKSWSELILGTYLPKYQSLNSTEFFKDANVCLVGDTKVHTLLHKLLRDHFRISGLELVSDIASNEQRIVDLYRSGYTVLVLTPLNSLNDQGVELLSSTNSVQYLDNKSFLRAVLKCDKSIWESSYIPESIPAESIPVALEEETLPTQAVSYSSRFSRKKDKLTNVDPFDMIYGLEEVTESPPDKNPPIVEKKTNEVSPPAANNGDQSQSSVSISSRRKKFQQLQNSNSKREDFLLFGDNDDDDDESAAAARKEDNPVAEVAQEIVVPVIADKQESLKATKVIKGAEFVKLQSILEARAFKEQKDQRLSKLKAEVKDVKPNLTSTDNSKLIGILQRAKQAKTEEFQNDDSMDTHLSNKEIREKIDIVRIELKSRPTSTFASVGRGDNDEDKWRGLKNFKKFVPKGRNPSSRHDQRNTGAVMLVSHQQGLITNKNKDIMALDEQILNSQLSSEFNQFDSEFNDLRIARKRPNVSTLMGNRRGINQHPTQANTVHDALFVADSEDDEEEEEGRSVSHSVGISPNLSNNRTKKMKFTEFEPEFTKAVDDDFEDDEDLGMPKFKSSRARR